MSKNRRLNLLDQVKGDVEAVNRVGEMDKGTLEYLPVSRLRPLKNQPRYYFDDERLHSLEKSVKEKGILTPLLLRPSGDGYEIVAGERRWRVATKLGLTTVPARVKHMSDAEAIEVALQENLQREDLNPLEETDAYLEILSVKLGQSKSEVVTTLYRMKNDLGEVRHNVMPNSEFQTIFDLFEANGRMSWYSFIQNRLPLLKLPIDLLSLLRAGTLDYTKAIILKNTKDEKQRQQLTQEVLQEGLSVVELRKRLKPKVRNVKVNPDLSVRISKITRGLKKSVNNEPAKQQRIDVLLRELEELLFSK
ncbi:MAG: ParB/RepB/Spo0J family partition protein [Trueperaceae bacterium]